MTSTIRIADTRLHVADNDSETESAEPVPAIQLLRAVIDSFSVGVVVLDRDLRYLLVNEAGAALNGRRIEDHIGNRAIDVVPEVFPLVEPFFQEVFRTGKSVRQSPFQGETPAIPGVLRWWDVHYHPLLDTDGEVVAVSASFHDVTETVAAETKLKYTMQEMRTILDVLPVGLAIAHDAACDEVELNGTYRRMINIPPDKTFNEWSRSHHRQFILDGKEVPKNDLPLRKAAATGQPTDPCRIDIQFPEGGSVNVLACAAPLIIEGVAKGAVASYVDITEQVQIQDRLRTAHSVQRDFLAMVSHELRTPLTMILGNAQLLGRGEKAFSEEDRRVLATDVYVEAVALSRIVENLLLMTRIDRGESLQPEPVVMRHICNKVVGELTADEAARCRQAHVDTHAIALANPTSVEQVMRNLVSNALKYSPQSEFVDLSLEVCGDDVVVRIADRGVGIADDDRERIFEPFFRAASTATRSGMGIGLAVCRHLTEAMGGTIWAEGRQGGGSVFSFALKNLEASEA